jgi:dTDP-4-amino-4,6-dideoxygalactose transaminase
MVGTIGAATCFSFYATKNLPIGEGGMITTADAGLATYLRTARLHGMTQDAWRRYLPGGGWRYRVEVQGLKANLTDLQAAIGRAQLKHFGRWQERRVDLARRYDYRLSTVPGVSTPPWPARGLHAWHLYVLRVRADFGLDRDAVFTALQERGIDCSVHFIPVHHHPYFAALGREGAGLPSADAAFAEIISLPLYPSLSDAEVDRVCEAIAGLAPPRHTVMVGLPEAL